MSFSKLTISTVFISYPAEVEHYQHETLAWLPTDIAMVLEDSLP